MLDASIAEARVTGDGGRLAVCLASRGWLALRRGDPSAAEGRRPDSVDRDPAPCTTHVPCVNGGVLIKALVDQGKLDDAEQALAPLIPK